MESRLRAAALVLLALTLAGCASARVSDSAIDDEFRAGQYEKAEARLQQGLAKQGEDGKDLLLYLLDLGLTLHTEGKYEESNRYFARADKIAEIKDYTSLSREFSTFLVSDNVKDYKGEDFEKVMINMYQSMNYALMGDYENALVEARVVNRKLHLMVTEGERKYKQNAFARYLSAILYEAERNWNDAYVEYKLTREIDPSTPGLGRDLWRLAWLGGWNEDLARWEKEYELTADDKKEAKLLAPKNGKGEIVVIFQNGIAPIKKPNPEWNSLPHFVPRYNPVSQAEVQIGDGVAGGPTRLVHSIEATAIENLNENYSMMQLKKVGGLVAKVVVAKQVENVTKSPLAGALTQLALFASDQPDLRSWQLLPKDLQIARFAVAPGTYPVRVTPVGGQVAPVEKVVQVKPGQKVFVSFRYVPR